MPSAAEPVPFNLSDAAPEICFFVQSPAIVTRLQRLGCSCSPGACPRRLGRFPWPSAASWGLRKDTSGELCCWLGAIHGGKSQWCSYKSKWCSYKSKHHACFHWRNTVSSTLTMMDWVCTSLPLLLNLAAMTGSAVQRTIAGAFSLLMRPCVPVSHLPSANAAFGYLPRMIHPLRD